MKKLLLFSIIVLLLAACSKEDPAPMPIAKFSTTESTYTSPCEVVFVNESANATSYIWDFGDGKVSTESSPSHTYEFGGDYIVKLTAKSDLGEVTTTETVIVTPEVREQALGAYTYTAIVTFNDTTSTSSSGVLTISRNPDDSKAIDIDLDGTIVYGNKIQEASNGFGFDISSWKETDSQGDSYEVTGVKSATIGNAEYQGIYESAKKTLRFQLYVDYDNNYYDDYNYTISVTATKND